MKWLNRIKEKFEAAIAASGKKKNLFAAGSDRSPAAGAAPRKKRVGLWTAAALVLIAGAALLLRLRAGRVSGSESLYTYASAQRRDITDTLSGSGVLEPADSYTVATLVSGDILSADFEEGDVVSKGDVLYEIDSSDAATSIERAELAVSQSRRTYEDKTESLASLNVTAPIGGTITGITLKAGDMAAVQSAVATIENTAVLTLTEYYADAYAGQIYAGMSAAVSVPDQMLSLTGKVSEVSSRKRTSDTGISCFAVTVSVENPGVLSSGTAATCWLSPGADAIYPSITDDDGLDAAAVATVYAKVSGTVSQVRVKNGETVYAGQSLLQLTSDTLNNEVQSAADALRDAELSLQSQNDTLKDYTVTAPIDGTIIDKYYKQGETSEGGKALCIIYDLSYLTLTLDVDELDISQISVGQKAAVTAEAVPGSVYQGVITKIGLNSTTAGGVTTYPVSIRIADTKGLLPGMNVDISIIVRESKDALSIPADAVEHSGRVLVKTADGTTAEGAPEGYAYAQVKTGASDDDYVEILSGIADGDMVAYIPETASGSNILGQRPPGAEGIGNAEGPAAGGSAP